MVSTASSKLSPPFELVIIILDPGLGNPIVPIIGNINESDKIVNIGIRA